MHKLYLALCFFFTIFISVFVVQKVDAISPSVVIYQVQAGGEVNTSANGFLTTPATREFISIYNTSDQEVDVTDWCLLGKSDKTIICLSQVESNIFFHMPGYSYITISSENFSSDHKYTPDFTYQVSSSVSGSIIASSDDIKLVDANGVLIDEVSWSSNLSGGYLLQRSRELPPSLALVNTGSSSDFVKIYSLILPVNDTIEEFEVFDACKNIVGIQTLIPEGYEAGSDGDCNLIPVDVCLNLDGMQISLPDGYLLDINGDCQADICINLDGLQVAVPEGMVSDTSGACFIKPLPLKITELLPNPVGSDTSNEFIEIYNPNDVDVYLKDYGFYIGDDYLHKYTFAEGSFIKSNQYTVFYNNEIKFTLVNAESFVRLVFANDSTIDETTAYQDAVEGMSWALFDNIWRWTNQPTPSKANLSSLIENKPVDVSKTSVLVPCKDGQYRSEETHRCRNIVNDVVDLMPCAEGQERNPSTNRCRSIVAAVLGENDLKPCGVGQERNPETNRCRNIVASTIPSADYAPDQTVSRQTDYTSWYFMAGICAVAIAYGVWEWRVELNRIFKKLFKIK